MAKRENLTQLKLFLVSSILGCGCSPYHSHIRVPPDIPGPDEGTADPCTSSPKPGGKKRPAKKNTAAAAVSKTTAQADPSSTSLLLRNLN